MTTINKLKAALAALEESRDDVQLAMDENKSNRHLYSERIEKYYKGQLAKHDQSITDLRSVIAEMEAGEPVGYVSSEQLTVIRDADDGISGVYMPMRKTPGGLFTLPLFTHPLPKAEPVVKDSFTTERTVKESLTVEPVQEPVAWMVKLGDVECFECIKRDGSIPLYANPQPKSAPQAKPLTDEQIDAVTDVQWAANNNKPVYAAHRAYARAIEAAHGIKP